MEYDDEAVKKEHHEEQLKACITSSNMIPATAVTMAKVDAAAVHQHKGTHYIQHNSSKINSTSINKKTVSNVVQPATVTVTQRPVHTQHAISQSPATIVTVVPSPKVIKDFFQFVNDILFM